MHATSTDIPADCVTPLFLSIFFLAQAYCSSLGSRVVDKGICLMILPQVHLRKPCYDFYFL